MEEKHTDQQLKFTLQHTARWATILAWGWIAAHVVFGILFYLIWKVNMADVNRGGLGSASGFLSIFYFLIMLVWLGMSAYPLYCLFRFARTAKDADADSAALATAIGHLKNFLGYLAVITLVVVVIYTLVLVQVPNIYKTKM